MGFIIGGLEALGFAKRHKRTIFLALAALAILGGTAWAFVAIDRYFDGVTATRTKLTQAEREAKALAARIANLGEAIDANARAHARELAEVEAARLIAEQERDAAVARAERYERIRDAARNAPVEDRGPVSPVVRDTVDRLWPRPGA